jgi:hypothetical protein
MFRRAVKQLFSDQIIILIGCTSAAMVLGLMVAIVQMKKQTQTKLYVIYQQAQEEEADNK